MDRTLPLAALVALVGCATTAPSKAPEMKPAAIAYTLTGESGARPVRKGNPDKAEVSIVAFEDFECAFCAKANETLAELSDTYGDKLEVIFMHNPLPFHKLALPAAMLAAAADRQGKFWEVHDLLFESNGQLSGEVFDTTVSRSNVDMAQLEEDFRDPELLTFIRRSQAIAKAVGVKGTPSFFVNGRFLPGAQPAAKFKQLIDEELMLSSKAESTGQTWLRDRIKANNPELYGYLYMGKVPPDLPAEQAEENETPKIPETVFAVSVNPEDAHLGPIDAPATLVIFSEFECPYCAKLKPTLAKLRDTFGDQLRIVFKHQPLAFHAHAKAAAEAALCAKDQGQFWPMHDLLFTRQEELGSTPWKDFANEIGLAIPAFTECLEDGRKRAQIARNQALAARVGVRGTPNSFVNGRMVQGAQPFSVFEELVREELDKAKHKISEGMDPKKLYDAIVSSGKEFPDLSDRATAFSSANLPIQGDWNNAPMKIVVFSDFECPYCSKVAPILEAVRRQLGWKVAVGFKHFPLSFHKLARPAARASLCAQKQGKFWEFHDALFQAQESWSSDSFLDEARALALDMEAFQLCLKETSALDAVIDQNLLEGKEAGVEGTPTIFVNGRKLDAGGSLNASVFDQLADGKLKTVISASKNSVRNDACQAWLRCLGAFTKLTERGQSILQRVGTALEKESKADSPSVQAACRAGLSQTLEIFGGGIPDACR